MTGLRATVATVSRDRSVPTLRAAIVLGLLSMIGPFAIDLYLPALPTIGADLGTGITAVQLTLVSYFLGFGIAQLGWGPWSDAVGRRLPLLAGLAIFGAATLACAFAPTVEWLIAARFVQGIGGAVVMVVPRAVIRDLYTGNAATRLMALVMLVIGISPMLAPLAGSGIIALAGWRAVFAVLVAVTLASATLTLTFLPETLVPERRVPVRPRALLASGLRLLRDRDFVGLTLVGAFGFASFFVFLAAAPFIYTQAFGLDPTGFSVAFAINALGFFAASQAAAPLGARFGAGRVASRATAGFALVTLLLLAVTLLGGATLGVTVAMLALAYACLGLVIPTTMVMALDPHGEVAGLAFSLGGTIQMLTGGLAAIVAGPFLDGTLAPMLIVIAMCATASFVLARLVLSDRAEPARPDGAL